MFGYIFWSVDFSNYENILNVIRGKNTSGLTFWSLFLSKTFLFLILPLPQVHSRTSSLLGVSYIHCWKTSPLALKLNCIGHLKTSFKHITFYNVGVNEDRGGAQSVVCGLDWLKYFLQCWRLWSPGACPHQAAVTSIGVPCRWHQCSTGIGVCIQFLLLCMLTILCNISVVWKICTNLSGNRFSCGLTWPCLGECRQEMRVLIRLGRPQKYLPAQWAQRVFQKDLASLELIWTVSLFAVV